MLNAIYERFPVVRRSRDFTYEVLSKRYVLIAITVLPVLSLFLFVNVLPIIWAIVAGVFEISLFDPTWKFVGMENYTNTLTDPDFWASFRRSLVFAGGSVALQLTVGTAIALLINKSFRFSKSIRAIVMTPYLIPTAILGFLALWMGNSQFGIINWSLIELGVISSPIPWFGSIDLAMFAVILVNSWKFQIFVTIMVLARLQTIPDGFYEAAELAGASGYEKFRDITLPNLKGVIFIVLLLRGIWMFNKFDIIFVLTQGGPGDATSTAPIYAYDVAFQSYSLGRSAAVSTILFIMLFAFALVYFWKLQPAKEVRTE